MSSVSVSTDEADTLIESVDADAWRRACSDDVESCCRLTAAEELRGHLLDCFSLYGSRFEHSTVTLACIQPLLRLSSSPVQHSSCPDASRVSEAEEKELCSAVSAFDVSTVATVLFLRVGTTSGTFGGAAGDGNSEDTVALLGVVASFQYWRGFRCVAERLYSSAAEAQEEAEALESAHLTVSEVLRMPSWKLIGEPVVEESSAATTGNSHADLHISPTIADMAPRFAGDARNAVTAQCAAYESLMALMAAQKFLQLCIQTYTQRHAGMVMPALLVYFIILAIAAGVTFALFGEVAEADVAPADALGFFAAATRTTSDPATSSLEAAAGSMICGEDCSTHKDHDTPANESGLAHIKALLMKRGVPPQQQEMISFLGKHCCVLPVKSHTVRVLNHPVAFYEELKKRVMASQRSITLSALYIGDGPLAKAFVACLEERVRWAAAGGHPFSITILLDYNRMQDRRNLVSLTALMELAQQAASTASPTALSGSRSGGSSIFTEGELEAGEEEAMDDGGSEAAPAGTTATGTAASAGVRVHLFLYQNPSRWNRLFAPFGRAKEVLGVQHTKIFVFDQRHTILTGANLSDDYFATRMDRYMIVEDNSLVARWFTRLVGTASRVSHPVICRKEFSEQFLSGGDTPTCQTRSGSDALQKFSPAASPTSRAAVATVNSSFSEPLPSPVLRLIETARGAVSSLLTALGSRREGTPTLHRKSNLVILSNALQVDPSVDTGAFCARTNALLHDFATWARRLSAAEKIDWDRYDTFLFPTVQAGRAGVYHDSAVVKRLLRLSTAEDHIFMTSPYLNMYAPFVDEVLHGSSYVDCITASVQTNGWNGHRGVAGRIPLFYLQLERAFYHLVKAYNCLSRVHIREFSVKGLTFHAKGLWFVGRQCHSAVPASFPPAKDGEGDVRQHHDSHSADAAATAPCSLERISAPYLVAYGSTNYGYRSVHKDVEAEAFLLTTSDALRETLRQELLFLLQKSVPVTEAQFVGTAVGRFQPVISLLAHLGQDFL